MSGVKIYLRLWHFGVIHQFILLWLASVIFELVLSTPDVHRIVLKTHRKTRDRDHHYKSHHHSSDHRYTRKPPAPAEGSGEDDWLPITTRRPHHSFNNYRSHPENDNKRGRSRDRTTVKPLNIAEIVELTTTYPEKLPIPIIDSIYSNYQQISNNSLDLNPPRHASQYNAIDLKGKVRQHREKESTTLPYPPKGYEVYEEIIGDILPPPAPRLNLNVARTVTASPAITSTIQSNIASTVAAVVSTPLPNVPAVTIKAEESHIQVINITDHGEAKNRTSGRRTKLRRNRGNSRSSAVQVQTQASV